MRLPLEIAMEVGSFLDGPSLTDCTRQLCWSGVGFVSRPCTDSAKVTTIQLRALAALCRKRYEAPTMDQEQTNGLATEAIKRIDLCLARRTSVEKVVFVFDLAGASADFNSAIHRHYSLSSNLQFENRPSLAVECHARARPTSKWAVVRWVRTGVGWNDLTTLPWFPSLHTLDLSYADVCDVSALASCESLHTLDLRTTQVSDVSPLASCQALHTLDLMFTRVSDVSALASCQALHTLNLTYTEVSDVSALVASGSLRIVRGCEKMRGYRSIAKLLKDRRR
jgi:hypothetical protein